MHGESGRSRAPPGGSPNQASSMGSEEGGARGGTMGSPTQGNGRYKANVSPMGVSATNALLADTASSLQSFVRVFAAIYVLLILIWILFSWIRLPNSRTTQAVQEFLD